MADEFEKLLDTMRKLRSPEGCPWDREQTHKSLAPYLIEECYEAFSAIEKVESDPEALKEELGDILLQVVFHSLIAEERGDFSIRDVVEGVTQKLILRHPHVFGDEKFTHAEEVLRNWDRLKAIQREITSGKSKEQKSILESVPIHFPALLEALKLSKEAAKFGFDWQDIDGVFNKIEEEINELKEAVNHGQQFEVEEEIGDLLFAVVNLARKLGVEPETALKRANMKFRERFQRIEELLSQDGKNLEGATLEEMDRLWEKAKR